MATFNFLKSKFERGKINRTISMIIFIENVQEAGMSLNPRYLVRIDNTVIAYTSSSLFLFLSFKVTFISLMLTLSPFFFLSLMS